jgi:hypothetical protein
VRPSLKKSATAQIRGDSALRALPLGWSAQESLQAGHDRVGLSH